MFKAKIFFFLISLKTIFCGCNEHIEHKNYRPNKEKYKIEKIGFLDNKISESSGLTYGNSNDTYFTMNDDSDNKIYEVNQKGKLLNTYTIPDVQTMDWEELTKDSVENLYIGNFGNNYNTRKDLSIYKTKLKEKNIKTEKINIAFAEQTAFPPIKKQMNFDCEAFFWYRDSLYLFSKNRGEAVENMYVISDKPGNYTLTPKTHTKLKGMVTAANINPQKTRFALLTYGYIYIFDIVNGQISFSHPRCCIKFTKGKQSEGLLFINETDMLITNEGGHIFLASKKD